MKFTGLSLLLLIALLFVSCGTTQDKKPKKACDLEAEGNLEITKYTTEKSGVHYCSIQGVIVDEDESPLIGVKIYIKNPVRGTITELDGSYKIDGIPPGNYSIIFEDFVVGTSVIQLTLQAGDKVTLDGKIDPEATIQLEKPIIYLYPEEEMEVHVELNYDGQLTTTYPTYSKNGWTVNVRPDGTLFDQRGKEYYALYWEGNPRQPLEIPNGFVVPREETVSFLEGKLELLGLTARESNEFIIYWLPILKKNTFNVIHFAEEDYLKQAQLTVSPKPETTIRIAMVFQGLDEPIEIPIQDLTSLKKTRKGFTLVEWGGQELPKMSTNEI